MKQLGHSQILLRQGQSSQIACPELFPIQRYSWKYPLRGLLDRKYRRNLHLPCHSTSQSAYSGSRTKSGCWPGRPPKGSCLSSLIPTPLLMAVAKLAIWPTNVALSWAKGFDRLWHHGIPQSHYLELHGHRDTMGLRGTTYGGRPLS